MVTGKVEDRRSRGRRRKHPGSGFACLKDSQNHRGKLRLIQDTKVQKNLQFKAFSYMQRSLWSYKIIT